jgi:hypothetical protein
MNLDNVYGSAPEVKEIVARTYVLNVKYLFPDRGDDLFKLGPGYHLRCGTSMYKVIGGWEVPFYSTDPLGVIPCLDQLVVLGEDGQFVRQLIRSDPFP